jgi:hypothetical protein
MLLLLLLFLGLMWALHLVVWTLEEENERESLPRAELERKDGEKPEKKENAPRKEASEKKSESVPQKVFADSKIQPGDLPEYKDAGTEMKEDYRPNSSIQSHQQRQLHQAAPVQPLVNGGATKSGPRYAPSRYYSQAVAMGRKSRALAGKAIDTSQPQHQTKSVLQLGGVRSTPVKPLLLTTRAPWEDDSLKRQLRRFNRSFVLPPEEPTITTTTKTVARPPKPQNETSQKPKETTSAAVQPSKSTRTDECKCQCTCMGPAKLAQQHQTTSVLPPLEGLFKVARRQVSAGKPSLQQILDRINKEYALDYFHDETVDKDVDELGPLFARLTFKGWSVRPRGAQLANPGPKSDSKNQVGTTVKQAESLLSPLRSSTMGRQRFKTPRLDLQPLKHRPRTMNSYRTASPRSRTTPNPPTPRRPPQEPGSCA